MFFLSVVVLTLWHIFLGKGLAGGDVSGDGGADQK